MPQNNTDSTRDGQLSEPEPGRPLESLGSAEVRARFVDESGRSVVDQVVERVE